MSGDVHNAFILGSLHNALGERSSKKCWEGGEDVDGHEDIILEKTRKLDERSKIRLCLYIEQFKKQIDQCV